MAGAEGLHQTWLKYVHAIDEVNRFTAFHGELKFPSFLCTPFEL
jgi:hypothetical protein